ncbi:putative B3 domain-containing protein At1g78640 [Eutrema salsugineum]|uniref:putative B3 domain-containing protein At1g78640 n=1 Tax=Eutrema salsugineum TaxID=72664 RepID=UPI000CECE806|nr:putative B3 domain-containing protein At1g78640 [Eutrema salsugineum]
MSISDDHMPPAKKIRTSPSQQPRESHQEELSSSASNETEMYISDDPMPMSPAKNIRTCPSQQTLETSQDSSLLPSTEPEILLFGTYMTPGKKSQRTMWQEPRVMSASPMNTDEEDLKKTTDLLEKEEERNVVSTKRPLVKAVPVIIKKILTENDIRGYFYLNEGDVESHILRYLSEDDQKNKLRQGDGIDVNVYDHDTRTTHRMLLVRSKANHPHYRLKYSWYFDFVERRGLKIGDEVELFWDSKFHIRVLSRGTADGENND